MESISVFVDTSLLTGCLLPLLIGVYATSAGPCYAGIDPNDVVLALPVSCSNVSGATIQ